jgi:7-keto-8-aminopelargonate synthetase-like enzyme
VPRGTSRLRVSITAAHDESMLSSLASAISEIVRGRF